MDARHLDDSRNVLRCVITPLLSLHPLFPLICFNLPGFEY